MALGLEGLLGGPWAVMNVVISRVTLLLTHIKGLITPLITTDEPPSIVESLQGARLENGIL